MPDRMGNAGFGMRALPLDRQVVQGKERRIVVDTALGSLRYYYREDTSGPGLLSMKVWLVFLDKNGYC